MAELKYWLWLATRGAQRRDALTLLDHFGSPDEIYFADGRDLGRVLEEGCEPFLNKSMSEPRKILLKCEEESFDILTLHDSQYPSRLKNIFDPPLVLYVKGRLPNLDDRPAIAMVGTRSCTPYGVVSAEKLGYETASYGGVVVTGMARGIDSAAARGALRAGGRVVGVLGCGLDIVYPRSNGRLFEDVSATGALISEFPPGTPPAAFNFPVRNRVMSGISTGVVVVEAPERSGALITAALALEQGRDVFAVPGNIDAPSCRGSNALLKEGASPAMNGWDIMSQYIAIYPDAVRAPEGVKLRTLDGEAVEALAGSETAHAPEKRKVIKTRPPEPVADTPKNQENKPDATKKAIDNESAPVYIDIMIDPKKLTLDERTVLDAMTGRRHVDEIITSTALPPQAVMAALTVLEIEGAVTREPGRYFVPHFKYVNS